MSSEKTSLEDLKVDTIRKGTKRYKIKSYVYFVVVILIFLVFIVFMGKLGNDFLGLLIFLLLMILPVLIVFRHKLPSILPGFLEDKVYEIDHKPIKNNENEPILPYDINKKHIQTGTIAIMVVLIIGSILLIYQYKKNLRDGTCIYQIMGSLACLIVAGIILGDVTGKDFTLGSDNSPNVIIQI